MILTIYFNYVKLQPESLNYQKGGCDENQTNFAGCYADCVGGGLGNRPPSSLDLHQPARPSQYAHPLAHPFFLFAPAQVGVFLFIINYNKLFSKQWVVDGG